MYAALELAGDPHADVGALLESMAEWPLWPDVTDTLPDLAAITRSGSCPMSTTDCLPVAGRRHGGPALVITSQRLQVYKPCAIY